MAGMTVDVEPRVQIAAILKARWLMFQHSLRTDEGKMELMGRIIMMFLAALMGLGGAFGLGSGSYFLVQLKRYEFLPLPLWGVLLFWQFFPVIGTTFSGNLDAKSLVRFPLSYRSFYLVQVLEGVVGPTALVPCLWLTGVTIGIGLAQPSLLPATLLVMAAFAATNLLLSRMILTWVDRWMEQRRTREIFALVFFLLMMCMQFIGPVLQRMGHKQQEITVFARTVATIQKPLPPGAAALAITGAAKGEYQQTALYFALLVVYGAIFARVLGVRLKAQYRGENLSEVERRRDATVARRLTPGWDVLGLPGPIAAVFQKEIKYISRSGQMILAMISPVLVLFVFRAQGMTGRHGPSLQTSFAFPIGTALALMSVTNMYLNTFGGEGGGMQMLYAAPVTFREIVMGKNLAHAAIFAMELALIWIALAVMGLIPSVAMVLATVIAVVFAILAEATVGNLLSLFLPKKLDFGKFMNRQQGSSLAVFANLGATAGIVGLSATGIYLSTRAGQFWIGFLMLAVLVGLAILVYRLILGQVDPIARSRQDKLLAELCKTS